MSHQKPDPSRFEFYTELANGKGFTIPNCKFIFKYDRFGGWKDENGNYFNSDGQLDEQPEEAQLTPSEESVASYDDENQYDKLYGGNSDYEEEDYHENVYDTKKLEKIHKNSQKLEEYPANKELRVHFSNAPFTVSLEDMFSLYSEKVKEGLINIIFQLQKGRRNGSGYFVVENVNVAQRLINLEGEKLTQREIYFDVSEVQEFLLEPLTTEDLIPLPVKKKDNVPKFIPAPAEKKVEKKAQKVQEKTPAIEKKKYSAKNEESKSSVKKEPVIEKKEEPKAVEKKEVKSPQLPEFSMYELNFEVFSTKTRFVKWMEERNAKRDQDYKNISKKEEGEKTVITMEVRNSLVEKLKGDKYEGKEVIFTLI